MSSPMHKDGYRATIQDPRSDPQNVDFCSNIPQGAEGATYPPAGS